ncbi:MAG: hypothetical protein HC828_16115, partial [Blastochloris sp.]|nr:hypothetical protein [Blastochloris sp.]
MLRSLVAITDPETEGGIKLMRNVSREKIEQAFERGDKLWLDLVDPNEEEIRWLEKLVQLNPVVVNDLLREDRRPALLVYRRYLFLSLFQPNIKTGRVEGREVHCLLGET